MTADIRYYLVTDEGWVLAGGLSLAQAGHEIARLMDEADGSHEPLPSDSVAEQLAIDWDDGEIAGRSVSLLREWAIGAACALRRYAMGELADSFDPLDPCL